MEKSITNKPLQEIVDKEVLTAIIEIEATRDKLCEHVERKKNGENEDLFEIAEKAIENLNEAVCYLAENLGKELTNKILK